MDRHGSCRHRCYYCYKEKGLKTEDWQQKAAFPLTVLDTRYCVWSISRKGEYFWHESSMTGGAIYLAFYP